MKKTIAASSFLYALPFLAFAQGSATNPGTIGGIIKIIMDLVNLLLPLMMALALLAFFYGLAKYIFASGSGEGQKEGRSVMIAGIVGLFLMVSIWGIVKIIGSTFGVSGQQTIIAPKVQIQ